MENKKIVEIAEEIMVLAEKENNAKVIDLCAEIKAEEGSDVHTAIKLYHKIKKNPLYKKEIVESLLEVIYDVLDDIYEKLK